MSSALRCRGVLAVSGSVIGALTCSGALPDERLASQLSTESGLAIVAGQIELARLVDLAAARNGVSIEYDPAVIKGSTTLRIDSSLSDRDLWDLMNRVLAQRGFTTLRTAEGRNPEDHLTSPADDPAEPGAEERRIGPLPNDLDAEDQRITEAHVVEPTASYTVTRITDAPSLVVPYSQILELGSLAELIDREGGSAPDDAEVEPHLSGPISILTAFDALGPTPGYTSVLVRVRHVSTKDAVDAANRVLSKSNSVAVALVGSSPRGQEALDSNPDHINARDTTAHGGTTGLIQLADLTPRLERALELLAAIDRPGAATVIEEALSRYLPAQQLATLAMQVAAKRDAVWGGAPVGGAGGGVSEKTPGEVMASPDGTSVLIVAPRETLDWWKSLIERLDKREPVSVATYRPRHFPAADVANLIEQTVRDIGAGPAGSGSGGATSGGSGRDDRWKLVIDDLTGSLIITATPAQHAAITDLIARLDATPAAARRPVRSFVIKNRSVNEVRSILEELIQAGVLEAGAESTGSFGSGLNNSSGGSPVGAAQVTPFPPPPQPDPILSGADVAGSTRGTAPSGSVAGGTSTGTRGSSDPRRRGALEDETPELVLTVDEGTNTLIAVGEPRLLAQIESLLPTIDVRQPQVMLEVLLVTLSEAQTLDLGVELEQIIISGDVRIRLSSLFGLGMRGANGDRVGPDNANGFTGVVLSPGDFSVIIRALQTLNDGRSVSMPKLLVGNNQSATINSVLQQPFASVNASNTVSTTSFGGTQDAGTVVTIRPQIAEGDHLVMDYSVSLSSFVGSSSSATLPPPRQQNQVRSVATIPDGYTVVVGGIELETDSKSVSQVPLIGDIPLIGEAFKTRSKSGTRSKFYVFIRANVLRGRGFEDLKFLSTQDAHAARVDDGFPEVRARIIR